MLVLGRAVGEYVVIDNNIIVKVVKDNGSLKLAIDAPKNVKIERGEVFERHTPRPKQLTDFKP